MLTFSWGLVHMSQPVLLVIRVTFPKTTMQKNCLPAEVKVTADFDAAAVLPKDRCLIRCLIKKKIIYKTSFISTCFCFTLLKLLSYYCLCFTGLCLVCFVVLLL